MDYNIIISSSHFDFSSTIFCCFRIKECCFCFVHFEEDFVTFLLWISTMKPIPSHILANTFIFLEKINFKFFKYVYKRLIQTHSYP